MDTVEVGLEGVDLIDNAGDRVRWRAVVTTYMNRQASGSAGNFITSWASTSF
jgi:hypothetical protein